MKIVVLERNSVGTDVSVDGLLRFGDVDFYPYTIGEDEVRERVRDADIIIANKAGLNEHTLSGASKVRLINEFATGYDNIDLEYCKSRNIAVTNVVNYSTDAVTQHTFALALYVLEKLRHYDEYVKDGSYASQSGFSNYDLPFTELAGKNWGIVGMGHIGRKVAAVAQAFGCRVLHYAVSGNRTADLPDGVEEVDLDTLLRKSDLLSLHCPLSERSRGLINYEALSKMKPSAILINVARGPVVVDADLARALEEGLIAGAGLDVTGTEPMKNENPLSRLKDSNRLIITPHMAWASTEARHRVVDESIKNIEAFLNGEKRNRII